MEEINKSINVDLCLGRVEATTLGNGGIMK